VRVQQLRHGEAAWRGRTLDDRDAPGRVFLAKAVFDMPTTRALVEWKRRQPPSGLDGTI